MCRDRGQATIEWTGLVLLVSLALGAAVSVPPLVDGRSVGGWLVHSIVCAVRGGCDDGDDELRVAYGERDAALVRRYAPGIAYEPRTYTLPVDFRECRSHRCSDAPDDRDLDVHRAARGDARATAFTHVMRRGGETFIQYWLYYPDSTSTVAGARRAWGLIDHLVGLADGTTTYPGFHRDDWEGYQVRIDRAGRASVRATSHRGYQGCKQRRCHNRWFGWTGWTRVSRGSHAGHIPTRVARTRRGGPGPFDDDTRDAPAYPGRDLHERTSTPAGLNLVPLETLDTRAYAPLDPGITPPWRKEVYENPLSDSTS